MHDYDIIGCDYSEDYKEKYVKHIKETYKKKCLESLRVSKGFRKHISNLENIKVDFNYDYYLIAKLNKIEANVKYNYKDREDVFIKKDPTIDNGNQKIYINRDNCEDIKVTNDYVYEKSSQSVERKFNGKAEISADEKNEIILKGGNGFIPKDKSVYTSNIPKEKWPKNLTKSVRNKNSDIYFEIHKLAKESNAVYKRLRDSQSEYALFFEIEKIIGCYYDDKNVKIWFVPVSFNIKVKYNGQEYLLENITKINDISDVGENSEEYLEYLSEIERLGKKKQFFRVPRFFYEVAFVSRILMGIFFILEPLISNEIGNEIIKGSLYRSLCYSDVFTIGLVLIEGLLAWFVSSISEKLKAFSQKLAPEYSKIIDEEDVNAHIRKKYSHLFKRRILLSVMTLLLIFAFDFFICFI